MTILRLSLILLAVAFTATAGQPMQDKNFSLLTLLDGAAAIRTDPTLSKIQNARLQALDSATGTCELDVPCYSKALRFTPEQTTEISTALVALYRTSTELKALVDGPLGKSETYVRYNEQGGEVLLAKAWADCAAGLNRLIDVYALGMPPRYPAIDAMLYDPKAATWHRLVQTIVSVIGDDRASLNTFYAPSLRFGLELLNINHRDEAARFEPMEDGENAAAVKAIKATDWSKYLYSAIVVPGAGGDRPGLALSSFGKLRDEIAAKRYRDGKAPFIIVSGGFVHPDRTPYAEAIEMKKDLVNRLRIPAFAVIVDPHARHTTTNMRNAARLMYRYSMPFTMKALVSTDAGQSHYIEATSFEKRCLEELGYMPYKLLGRISSFDLEFLPLKASLHIDPQDALDP